MSADSDRYIGAAIGTRIYIELYALKRSQFVSDVNILSALHIPNPMQHPHWPGGIQSFVVSIVSTLCLQVTA